MLEVLIRTCYYAILLIFHRAMLSRRARGTQSKRNPFGDYIPFSRGDICLRRQARSLSHDRGAVACSESDWNPRPITTLIRAPGSRPELGERALAGCLFAAATGAFSRSAGPGASAAWLSPSTARGRKHDESIPRGKILEPPIGGVAA